MDDYYKLLGVSPTATNAEIKRAYHQRMNQIRLEAARGKIRDGSELLADFEQRNKAADQKMRQLKTAYNVLSDPVNRRSYDFYRNRSKAARRPSPGRQKQRRTKSSSTNKMPPDYRVPLVIIKVVLFIIVKSVIFNGDEVTSPEKNLQVNPTEAAQVQHEIHDDPTLESLQTLYLAQQSYETGMQHLQSWNDDGTVEDRRLAIQYFRQAMRQDPQMTVAHREYGLLLFRFWKLTADEGTRTEARNALNQYVDLNGLVYPEIADAIEQLNQATEMRRANSNRVE